MQIVEPNSKINPIIPSHCSVHGTYDRAVFTDCPQCARDKVVCSDATNFRLLIQEIEVEIANAVQIYGPFNSAHEGFAVLLEEVDELKANVWCKQKNRDLKAMRKEAMQVASMAIRFALEVCSEERGRK